MAAQVVIGIGGGSGCGKTFLARTLQEEAPAGSVAVISMDQYFKSIDGQMPARDVNFDHPSHLDIPLMVSHLEALRKGKAAKVPTYDFKSMVQTPEALLLQPAPVIVVEGLFVLANPVRPLLDLACFLDVEADQRFVGRLIRDTKERDTTVEQVIERYQRFVRSTYQMFVAPTRENADIIVDFTYRRSFFTRLLVHIMLDTLRGGFDMQAFLDSVRLESFSPGIRPDEGAMPLIPDIMELAKAYPEQPMLG